MALDMTSGLGIATLLVACIAFVIAVTQLMSTWVTSAKFLPSCGKKVMGHWARPWWKSLKLKWFHFEVQFDAPVIFLAREDNKRGPEGEREPIVYINWSNWTQTNTDEPTLAPDDDVPEPVHTVNNERASWTQLLFEIHRMERWSVAWDEDQWKGLKRPATPAVRTLAVGVQRKRRRFEHNPAIKKPYATTTLCHLIELAAALGIYWKEFDRAADKYRAEGNGYSLFGWRKSDFGILFVFEKLGWPEFERTRVIPRMEIKELCFGNVPTLWRNPSPENDLEWTKKPREKNYMAMPQVLRLGSRKEIADTLMQIGCKANAAAYLLDERKEHEHLFSISFEMMGMMGRILHVNGMCFTFLPNPTIFQWNVDPYSVKRLIQNFKAFFSSDYDEIKRSEGNPPRELEIIQNQIEELEGIELGYNGTLGPDALEQLHKTLDELDTIVKERPKSDLLKVLRRHFEVVLDAINMARTNQSDENTATRYANEPTTTGLASLARRYSHPKDNISFATLMDTPGEEGKREENFMKMYFEDVCVRVLPDVQVAQRNAEEGELLCLQHTTEGLGTTHSVVAGSNLQGDTQNMTATPASHGNVSPSTNPVTSSTPLRRKGTVTAYEEKRGLGGSVRFPIGEYKIWCSLVLRMLCWLLLHNFNKQDKQVPKSELIGNRLPVYIM